MQVRNANTKRNGSCGRRGSRMDHESDAGRVRLDATSGISPTSIRRAKARNQSAISRIFGFAAETLPIVGAGVGTEATPEERTCLVDPAARGGVHGAGAVRRTLLRPRRFAEERRPARVKLGVRVPGTRCGTSCRAAGFVRTAVLAGGSRQGLRGRVVRPAGEKAARDRGETSGRLRGQRLGRGGSSIGEIGRVAAGAGSGNRAIPACSASASRLP